MTQLTVTANDRQECQNLSRMHLIFALDNLAQIKDTEILKPNPVRLLTPTFKNVNIRQINFRLVLDDMNKIKDHHFLTKGFDIDIVTIL